MKELNTVPSHDTVPSHNTVKCLIWDLDNTLWKGTLLEGDDVALSEQLRAVIVELDSRGILQSVASRNDYDLAWKKLEQLDIAEYLILPQIGWGSKSEAVRHVADQLSFAHQTIAFIDDQAVERAEVAYHLPQVRCYPAEQATALPDLPEFNPVVVTGDARQRRKMYQASFHRDAARAAFTGPDEQFLRSLELVLRISRATNADLSRVEELTLRTSQMNATGVHYSDATLRNLLVHPRHEVLVATLTDRFGPYGAVSIVLLEKHPTAWHLKLLASSCRVAFLGAGTAILRWLIDQAARAGVHLVADFRRTDRNRMIEVSYRLAGFREQSCECHLMLSVTAGIQRLHLVPSPQCQLSTIRLTAPDLAAPPSAGTTVVVPGMCQGVGQNA